MQRVSKRIGIIALAMCLLAALAVGGVMAWAEGEPDWAKHADGNTLTINATNTDTMAEDIATADVVYDIYQVATAEKNGTYDIYDYTWVEPFGSGAVDLSLYPTGSAWHDRAVELATRLEELSVRQSAEVLANADAAKLAESDIKFQNGMYLVLPHGKDVDLIDENGLLQLKAYSATWEYTFQPTLVTLPSKAAQGVDADGYPIINTADSFGDWLTEVTISCKPERAPLFGSLRIDKTVLNPSENPEPATFVFHITGTTPQGEAYDNYASIYYTGGGSGSTTVTHIPAGTEVTVTEEYFGAKYVYVSDSDGTDNSAATTIIADRVVEAGTVMANVGFTNDETGGPGGGHGVENNVELAENGDWIKHVTPESDATIQ